MSNELSTAQVAERFGVTAITVRLWCRQGHFKNAREMPTPRGPVWMIPESDLKDFKPPKTGRPLKPKPSGTDGHVEVKVSKKGKKK